MADRVQLLKDFDEILEECKELQLVVQWLRVINVEVVAELPHNREAMALNDLRIAVDDFQLNIGLKEETLTIVRFFLSKKSMLFEAIALKYIKQLQYEVRNTYQFDLLS